MHPSIYILHSLQSRSIPVLPTFCASLLAISLKSHGFISSRVKSLGEHFQRKSHTHTHTHPFAQASTPFHIRITSPTKARRKQPPTKKSHNTLFDAAHSLFILFIFIIPSIHLTTSACTCGDISFASPFHSSQARPRPSCSISYLRPPR